MPLQTNWHGSAGLLFATAIALATSLGASAGYQAGGEIMSDKDRAAILRSDRERLALDATGAAKTQNQPAVRSDTPKLSPQTNQANQTNAQTIKKKNNFWCEEDCAPSSMQTKPQRVQTIKKKNNTWCEDDCAPASKQTNSQSGQSR